MLAERCLNLARPKPTRPCQASRETPHPHPYCFKRARNLCEKNWRDWNFSAEPENDRILSTGNYRIISFSRETIASFPFHGKLSHHFLQGVYIAIEFDAATGDTNRISDTLVKCPGVLGRPGHLYEINRLEVQPVDTLLYELNRLEQAYPLHENPAKQGAPVICCGLPCQVLS